MRGLILVLCLVACGSKKESAPASGSGSAGTGEAANDPPSELPIMSGKVDGVVRTIGGPVAAGSVLVPSTVVVSVLLPATADPTAVIDHANKLLAESPELRDLDIEPQAATAAEVGWGADAFVPGRAEAAADFEGMTPTRAVLFVTSGKPPMLPTATKLTQLAAALAGRFHGWVMLTNGSVYSVKTLERYVLVTPGDARKLITVQPLPYLESDALATMSTVGLRSRGLPELIVKGVPSGNFEIVATMLNATAQALLETPSLAKEGELVVDLSTLEHDWYLAEIKGDGGTGTITWRARWAYEEDLDRRPPQDPYGPQIELDAPGSSAYSAEALVGLMNTFAGQPPDNPVHREGEDAELEAAAKRARKELAALVPKFAKGAPREGRLSVKCGFVEGDLTEWMWVDVLMLTKTHVIGTLDNKPVRVKLQEGARVEVPMDLVADYILTKADGSKVGGYSVEIHQRRGR